MFLDGDIQDLDQDRRAEAHAGGSQDLQALHVGAEGVQGELITSPFLAWKLQYGNLWSTLRASDF